jgi:hypothetical protein
MLVAMNARTTFLFLRLARLAQRLRRGLRRMAPVLLVAAIVAPLVLAGDVFAQANNPVAPPEPGDVRGGFPIWVAYIAMLALTAAVLFVGLFPSKRGHQD